jgi:hypothetical protein
VLGDLVFFSGMFLHLQFLFLFVSGVDNKVYKIDNQDAVKSHLGQKVTVTGDMNGDTIHVNSVKM